MANVTTTTLALLGEEGVFYDAAVLRKAAAGSGWSAGYPKFTARLAAWLNPPSGGRVEALLAYQHKDYTTTDLPLSTIYTADDGNQRWEKVIGSVVDVSQYVQLDEPFVLRVRARITVAGTGQVVLPVVFVEWG